MRPSTEATRKTVKLSAAAAAVLVVTAAVAQAETIYVDQGGGGDYSDIQSAVDASDDGDVVLVATGTYDTSGDNEIRIQGKSITLRSLLGPEYTVLDAAFDGRCVLVEDTGIWNPVVIEGFTIQRGYTSSYGGGIRCENAMLTLIDCSVEDCTSYGQGGHENWGTGGGLYCLDSAVSISGCSLSGNYAWNTGGGIYCRSSELTITDSRLEHNEVGGGTGGGVCVYGAEATIAGCEFVRNIAQDGAAAKSWNPFLMENCTLVYNEASNGSAVNAGLGTILHCIAAFTDPGQAFICGGRTTIYQCLVFGNAEGDSLCGNAYDNLFVDPLFCDPQGGNFRLCSDSPCLSENNAWGVAVGANEEGCGACGTPVESRSWSAIRAMFR